MRVSELSRRAGVPVPTVKYYLREGLLPPGELTSPTQARYDEGHVRRLRLVRALVDVAGLSIERAREVLSLVDEPAPSMTQLLARAVAPGAPDDCDAVDADDAREATPRSLALLREVGWDVPAGLGALADLERALTGLEASGLAIGPDHLGALAAAVDGVAAVEIDRMPESSPADAVAYAVLGTELSVPVILALRRVAHARRSIERFGLD